jgi:putative FmdB family regulatory protein
MPLHDFECSNLECKHTYEDLIYFNEPIPTICPKCGQNTLIKLFGLPINPEVKTVGSLADKNSAKFTEAQKKAITERYDIKKNQQKMLNNRGWRTRYGK